MALDEIHRLGQLRMRPESFTRFTSGQFFFMAGYCIAR
jgi:hypothetical protein